MSFSVKRLTTAVAQFIVSDLRSISVVEFLRLMEVVEPRYQVPCRRTMSGIIEQKYLATKRAVHGVVSQQDWICLTMDMWTSCVGNGFYSLTVHFISPTFYMEHKILQCHHMAGNHGHTAIARAIESCANGWCFDLNHCVIALTTDNASNITKAIVNNLGLMHMPCAGICHFKMD